MPNQDEVEKPDPEPRVTMVTMVTIVNDLAGHFLDSNYNIIKM
jgi:hypothetical protein